MSEPRKTPSSVRTIYRYLSVGFEIAVALSVPMTGGYWIDQQFDTSPWFLLAGALLGIALFIRIAIRLSENLDSGRKVRSTKKETPDKD